MSKRIVFVFVLSVSMLAPATVASVASDVPGCDFDDDGYADLVVGAPNEDVGDLNWAGAVNVIYGSDGKLASSGSQLFHQDVAGMQGVAEASDLFGNAVACGHFDGDQYEDLAIGAYAERVGTEDVAGAVQILHGSAAGLTTGNDLLIHRDRPGVAGDANFGDSFGWALTAGDFNDDGWDDLAVGVPEANVGPDTGEVQVFYGTPGGLTFDDDERWYVSVTGVKGKASEKFGRSLASGDFDGDGFADLAIGDPHRTVGGNVQAGAVTVLFGGAGGLTTRDQLIHRNRKGIAAAAGAGDLFGDSLAAADLDGDGRDDLVVDVSQDDIGGVAQAGSVHVLYGGGTGLEKAGDEVWHRAKPGVKRAPHVSDRFGRSVTVADFDGDGRGDLAVGVEFDDNGNTDDVEDSGSVHVFYGTPRGVDASRDEVWQQGTKGIKGSNDLYDGFGGALAAGDYNANGRADLAIGVRNERVDGEGAAGTVQVVYGNAAGLKAKGDQTWSQNSPGIGGVAESADHFGDALG